MNLNSFIMRSELSVSSQTATSNPDLHPEEVSGDCEHYLCALRGRTHEMEFHYTCATGEGPPNLADSLRYLGAVAVEFESCEDMEEWATEYDFDPGHMDTRAAYDAIATLARNLWRLVGDDLYNELRQGIEIEQAVDIAWAGFEGSGTH